MTATLTEVEGSKALVDGFASFIESLILALYLGPSTELGMTRFVGPGMTRFVGTEMT